MAQTLPLTKATTFFSNSANKKTENLKNNSICNDNNGTVGVPPFDKYWQTLKEQPEDDNLYLIASFNHWLPICMPYEIPPPPVIN